ncbi:tetratricopeptide repeat protein [Pseudomonas sp. LPB0260]|uniref:tetratricopeptide repeat protein n=1 Tax=Pseudomonas sp. LPB0260 TaxID=2614442 RepID=UPI0015C1D862|nr:tetratricopeptide repeat protein [Pseudomonas sp. LPB0260]QLC72836.1 tetratricopeptide repeat protein [Pseudomonas sp. LPB0260]QLC75610.1 tetratricopeptide repeat protein [Pseudomonas sp. LPB0260]
MRNSSAAKPTRLLSPWALLLLALVVGGLLYLTHRSEEVFLPAGKQPDAVWVSYAELLLEARPENDELRLTLIEQLIKLGDYPRARRHLRELQLDETDRLRFYRVELDVLQALASRKGIERPRRVALVERLSGLSRDGLSTEVLLRHARYALSLSAPGLAADIYVELAGREPEKSAEWLGEAARWYLASGQQTRAAGLYLQLLEQAATAQQRAQWLAQAFAALRAGDRGEAAVEMLARHFAELRDGDPRLLAEAVETAIGSRRLDLATQFIRTWRAWRPDDPQAMALDFRVRLAEGDLQEAWRVGQALVEARADDPELLRQMAQLGEWVGETQAALGYWIRLLQLREDDETREHAWRLATQLFDFERAIPLLEGLSERRRLNDVELDALIYSQRSLGTPEALERWLRGYLRHHPEHRKAWDGLRLLLEHNQQFAAETRVWADMDKRFRLTVAERLAWAEAHWRLFDPAAAWQVLDAIDADTIDDEDYWRMRAALAWDLEQDDDAQRAYERLLALQVTLGNGDEQQLISLYRESAPDQALALLVKSWQRTRDSATLTDALQLAEQLAAWVQLQALVDEAMALPGGSRVPALWQARALLAERGGRQEEAERLYRQGLSLFPQQTVFRERLLWLYIDQGRRDELSTLLQQWRSLAREDSVLWLPFASANLLLNRTEQALAWYRLYLRSKPGDWLVQAAYADALDSGGYADAAQRLRRHLLNRVAEPQLAGAIERYRVYLRLVSSAQSGRRALQQAWQWQDGSQTMLQLWFEQLLARLDGTRQEAMKDEWLAWARSQGLEIGRYELFQEAMRAQDRDALERLLAGGGLDQAQRVEALTRLGRGGEALGEGLAGLSDEQPGSIRGQLLRQTVELHQRTPQGVQLSWQHRDFGGFDLGGPGARIARHLGNDWYADLRLGQGSYDAPTLDERVLGEERNLQLLLQRELSDGALELSVDGSWRDDQDRLGFGLARRLQLSSRDELEVSLGWHREADESGLMRALGMRDGLGVAGRHSFGARDQLSWSLAHQRYSTRQGDALGSGQQFNLEATHALFFEGPTWLLRSGISYQQNSLESALPDDLLALREVDGTRATPGDLLQERFGQLYLGSTWRRGFPGTLNRERAQYTWLVDVLAGWQWTEQEFGYALNTGVGLELFGDDELAFTFGYQSAPRSGGGEPGGTMGISYSARFGR